MVHGNYAVAPDDCMEIVASTDHYDHLATRHEDMSVRMVRYRPEFATGLLDHIADDFGRPDDDADRDLDDVTVD